MICLTSDLPVPEALRGAIVALGNFDGFHAGHQAVVGEAIRWAKAEAARPSSPPSTRTPSPSSPPMPRPSA